MSNASQLSPRQPPFNLQPNTQVQATQANWSAQQSNNTPIRLNLQQSNPMLNAQLSVRSFRKALPHQKQTNLFFFSNKTLIPSLINDS